MRLARSHLRRLPAEVAGRLIAAGRLDGDWLELPDSLLATWSLMAGESLVGTDRERWEAAGRPVHEQAAYSARKIICDGCADRVCAGCRRTEVYRWLPTQDCPLGFWPA